VCNLSSMRALASGDRETIRWASASWSNFLRKARSLRSAPVPNSVSTGSMASHWSALMFTSRLKSSGLAYVHGELASASASSESASSTSITSSSSESASSTSITSESESSLTSTTSESASASSNSTTSESVSASSNSATSASGVDDAFELKGPRRPEGVLGDEAETVADPEEVDADPDAMEVKAEAEADPEPDPDEDEDAPVARRERFACTWRKPPDLMVVVVDAEPNHLLPAVFFAGCFFFALKASGS
jgi:hypothetical protein